MAMTRDLRLQLLGTLTRNYLKDSRQCKLAMMGTITMTPPNKTGYLTRHMQVVY